MSSVSLSIHISKFHLETDIYPSTTGRRENQFVTFGFLCSLDVWRVDSCWIMLARTNAIVSGTLYMLCHMIWMIYRPNSFNVYLLIPQTLVKRTGRKGREWQSCVSPACLSTCHYHIPCIFIRYMIPMHRRCVVLRRCHLHDLWETIYTYRRKSVIKTAI